MVADALPRQSSVAMLDHKRPLMTSPNTFHFDWRIGWLMFGALALFSFAAALFFFISDPLHIRDTQGVALEERRPTD